MTDVEMWRVGLKGNVDRGRNKALAMQNMYGTADDLWFRTREDAVAVCDVLTKVGYPGFVVPPHQPDPGPHPTKET